MGKPVVSEKSNQVVFLRFMNDFKKALEKLNYKDAKLLTQDETT